MQYAVADTAWGPHVVPTNDLNVGHALMLYGEFSISQAATLYRLLRKGDTALDIGANIGALALPMLHAVGPTGRVICFEPQLPIARACQATLALNAESPDQFEVRQVAVGGAPGTLHVPPLDYDADINNFGCAAMVAAGGTPVRVVMLDHLVLPRVRLVKIDAEGMESEVIAGAREFLARDRPVMMVENDHKAKYPALIAQIEAAGYDCYWFLTPLFNPKNLRGQEHDIYAPGAGSIDMLCFPKGEALPDFLPNLPRATEEFAEQFVTFTQ